MQILALFSRIFDGFLNFLEILVKSVLNIGFVAATALQIMMMNSVSYHIKLAHMAHLVCIAEAFGICWKML